MDGDGAANQEKKRRKKNELEIEYSVLIKCGCDVNTNVFNYINNSTRLQCAANCLQEFLNYRLFHIRFRLIV
jgi:hypothetical protein